MDQPGRYLYSTVVTILCLAIQSSYGLRILGIFPMVGQSHFVTPKSLMQALAERGHQVDVYSHFPLKKPVPNYNDFSLAGSLPSLSNNMSFEFFIENAQGISVTKIISFAGNPTCKILSLPIFQKLIKDPPRNPPYDLVITELFVSNCYLAWGRHLNIPIIGVVSNGLFDWMHDPLRNPQNFAVDTSVVSGYMAPMTFYERLINTMICTYVKNSFNSYVREQDAYVAKYFGPGYPNVVDLQKDLALVLIDSHLPQDVQKFLDDSKHGLIYVSFGSMVRLETFPKFVLDAFYGTFKNIEPIRVLMKIAKPDELPPGLPPNVNTQTWLPQVKVLKHKNIKGFVTQGGLMGTQESIFFGVPMVGIPLFGDQHFNMKAYERKNLALNLEWKICLKKTLTEAVEAIIENPVYKKSVEKVSTAFRDVPMSPKEVVVFWVEYIYRHGKHALRSPLVDMPWWQASLLDVYGFIIFVLLLVLYVVKRILSFLFGIVLSSRKSNSKLKSN